MIDEPGQNLSLLDLACPIHLRSSQMHDESVFRGSVWLLFDDVTQWGYDHPVPQPIFSLRKVLKQQRMSCIHELSEKIVCWQTLAFLCVEARMVLDPNCAVLQGFGG